MNRILIFCRKWWIVLGAGVLVIALAAVWIASRGGTGNLEFEESIANYGLKMEQNPSAKTARRMLDVAISSAKDPLVFKVLKEHIHPWVKEEGVAGEFIRGSRWYFYTSLNVDNVLWLEEEIRKLDPGQDLNEDLADFYIKRLTGTKAVDYGNRLFVNWTLNNTARQHYLDCVKTLLADSPLPIQSAGDCPEGRLLEEFPNARADLAEFTDVPQYLQLWLSCFGGNPNEEFVSSLIQLSPESDPLDLYWSLWTVALLRDLEEGWRNPLGLGVADKLPDIIRHINEEHLNAVFATLYTQRDPAVKEQALLLLDLISHGEMETQYGYEVATLLLNAAGYDFSDVKKPAYTAQDKIIFPPDVESRYNELSGLLASDPSFERLSTKYEIPESSLKLHKSMNFYVQHEIRFSNSEPAALITSDQGQTLINIVDLKETSYSGYWGSWSDKGDRFTLAKSEGDTVKIRVMSADGQELARYTLPLNMPVLHVDERVFVPYARWITPWELRISYTALGMFYDEYPDQRVYKFDMNTQALTKLSYDEWEFWSYIPGTDMYFGKSLIYASGEKAGDDLKVSDSNIVKIAEDVKLQIEADELLLKTAQESVTLMDNVSQISWAAISGEEVYAKVYLGPDQSEPCSRYIAVNISTGEIRTLAPGNPWYDHAEFVIRGSTKESRLTSEYFQNEGWLFLNMGDEYGYGDDVTFQADGVSLPASVPGNGAVRLYKSGDSYILVAIQVRIHYLLDVPCSILIFR